jgi:hypothetical protein
VLSAPIRPGHRERRFREHPTSQKRASTSGYILSAASMHARPGRIQFVHRENSRRKQKKQRRSQPLAANGMASLLQGTLK